MTRYFCIFEGGGAKGIAHIGALRAFEEAKFECVGFAGTSAGAIVAALAACGYSSRELFNNDSSILDLIDGDTSNIWGGDAFKPLKTPPKLLGWLGWTAIRAVRHFSRFSRFFLVLLLVLATGVPYWMKLCSAATMIALQALLVLLLVYVPFAIIYPVASLKSMADAINQALSLKIRSNRDKTPITFADMRAANCAELKIVATDISTRSMILFSADTTPDIAVGDAVAASACIPGIFRAHRVGERLCYDGGLVSNLPAWAFDPERAIDRDSWTAVVEIGEVLRADRPETLFGRFRALCATCLFGSLRPRGLDILSATVSTAVFGGAVLNTRNVDRLRSQPLGVDLGLLEFGVTREKAAAIIDAARLESRVNIVYQMNDLPHLIEDMCGRLSGQALGLINIARTSEGLSRFEGRLRIAFFFPARGDPHSLLSEFNHGFNDDGDERLRLPVATSFVGRVWRERQAYYLDESERGEWDSYLSRPQDRWARKLRWNTMSWIVAIPHHHVPSDEHIVIAIDSDRPLELNDLDSFLHSLVELVDTMLRRNLPLEAFAWLK